MPLPEISEPHLLFVQEYVRDRNIVRAALAAGLSDKYKSAAEIGRRLLEDVGIKAWVKHVWGVQKRRLKTDVPDLVREWSVIGKSDVTDYVVRADGELDVKPGVPKAALRAVKKTKVTRTERLTANGSALEVETKIEIELHDKLAALAKLKDHFDGPLPGDKAGPPPLVISGEANPDAL